MLDGDLISDTLESLPPCQRQIIESVFFNGESEYAISRQSGLKRSEVRATVAAGLERLRLVLRCRGVRGVADVL